MTLKHQWSVSHNFLTGLTLKGWLGLLRQNHFAVDPAYWHRAAFITATSFLNSVYQRRESKKFDEAIADTEIKHAPVFVLGHWRSGTTHLHNLLAQNTDDFAYPNTYEVVNPHTFLTTEEVNSRRFGRLVPERRPMDNVALSFTTPQEDEFAPCLMTGYSPYLGIAFPRQEEHYERYLTFDGVPEEDELAWKNALVWFVKKLTLKQDRPILLKSPPHTARIRMLIELFPDAKFVHIHRNPYEVFQSTVHYYDTAVWYSYLQKPDRTKTVDTIIRRYQNLHEAYFSQRNLIPEGNFHELSFEDLERDPVGEVRGIYKKLDLQGFDQFSPRLESYVASQSNYRRNQFPEFGEETKRRVAREWRTCFDTWSYEI
jgi:hypothetical protein